MSTTTLITSTEQLYATIRGRVKLGFQLGSQLWGCLECGQIRMWGWFEPYDDAAHPQLGCARCHKPTRHAFWKVA